MVYSSTSDGVELEVQAGSLVDEVHHPVTISPRLQFVECRTEGSGRWGSYALALLLAMAVLMSEPDKVALAATWSHASIQIL